MKRALTLMMTAALLMCAGCLKTTGTHKSRTTICKISTWSPDQIKADGEVSADIFVGADNSKAPAPAMPPTGAASPGFWGTVKGIFTSMIPDLQFTLFEHETYSAQEDPPVQ
jgi:hypothetical protein